MAEYLRDGFERRYMDFEMREAEESGVIAGRAVVYNLMSEDLGGFREVISPGFFRDVLDNDVRALFNHDPSVILGRTRSGTLRLADGPDGLDFTVFYPETDLVRETVVEPMKRGDIDQCSFQFRVRENGDEWSELEDGTVVRRLLPGGCERLADVGVVTFAAYPQTSAEARDMAAVYENNEDGDDKSQAGDVEHDADTRARLATQKRKLDLVVFD